MLTALIGVPVFLFLLAQPARHAMNAARRALPVDDAPCSRPSAPAPEVGERWLCCEFSLSPAAGECLVLLVPNGAGKTTLLHTLAGLREPTVGEVRIGGCPYAAWPAPEAARGSAACSQQQPDLFAASVLETRAGRPPPAPGRWGWEGRRIGDAREALESVGLAGFEQRDVQTFRRRAPAWAIATLLAQAPRLFLLDEPLNHLDLHHQIAALRLPAPGARRQGTARSVLVLHDINLAARYADHIIPARRPRRRDHKRRDAVLRRPARRGPATAARIEHAGRAVFLPD